MTSKKKSQIFFSKIENIFFSHPKYLGQEISGKLFLVTSTLLYVVCSHPTLIPIYTAISRPLGACRIT